MPTFSNFKGKIDGIYILKRFQKKSSFFCKKMINFYFKKKIYTNANPFFLLATYNQKVILKSMVIK